MLKEGLTHTSHTKVTTELTAAHMQSGDMPVLATPALVALMENAAMLAVAEHLPDGATTVGGNIATSHLRPSALGSDVEATATLTQIDGKKLFFDVKAYMGEVLIGEGTHLRFIVGRDKFLSRL